MVFDVFLVHLQLLHVFDIRTPMFAFTAGLLSIVLGTIGNTKWISRSSDRGSVVTRIHRTLPSVSSPQLVVVQFRRPGVPFIRHMT